MDDGDEEAVKSSSGLPWEGSDRDYSYEELLGALQGLLPHLDEPVIQDRQTDHRVTAIVQTVFLAS